jgi:ribonuclease T2
MRHVMRGLTQAAAFALLPFSALADGERSGSFDYYVLALSWSSTYCTLEGDERDDRQCDTRNSFSFTLHGLWPQYDFGWPSYCPTAQRPPSRADTAAMADIMGSSGLAWHQWRKHGACTGLAADDYFELSRKAYGTVAIPEVFRELDRDVRLPASVVEDAFIKANPDLDRSMLTVTCDAGMIREVRICLDTSLGFRPCGEDAARDCRMRDALMEAVR